MSMQQLLSFAALFVITLPFACAQTACGRANAQTNIHRHRASNPSVQQETPLQLWYTSPASDDDSGWVSQSLPLGNGYMGVNVFGGVRQDRLQITENSLVDYFSDKIGGLNSLAELYLRFPHDQPSSYERSLSLNSATAQICYENNGVQYTREYFTSYPDKVLAVRLEASRPGALDFTLAPKIPYLAAFRKTPDDHRGKQGNITAEGDTITLSGVMDYYGIKYEAQIKIIPQGGTLRVAEAGDAMEVHGANSALLLVAVGTNYKIADPQVFSEENRLDKLKGFPDPHAKVSAAIAAASRRSYAELRTRHESNYRSFYSRVNFSLGAPTPTIPTDHLIDQARVGKPSEYLDELAFQFGRYLLISSSRAGALPPNLQGVWNVYQDPPWTAGYWHNINQQMNYWLAFNTNMPELFDSYIDFYRAYLPALRKDATEYLRIYHPAGLSADGDNGWAMGNSLRPLDKGGKAAHSGFGTGPWTTMLFWDDYDFTRDERLLRTVVYPAMRGQAKFLSEFVQDVDGKLLAKPSSSPENANALQTVGTTFDQQMIYENFRDTIEAAHILHIKNDPLIPVLQADLPKLDPILIGDSGQIKEYREETTYGSIGDPLHRHTSQLLGLYPGRLINSSTPAWLAASRVSLERRGMGNVPGWAKAERMGTWARLGDGAKAYEFYEYWLGHHAMYNLWNNHRDSITTKLFQIDGNLGISSAVAEMLLQSHEGVVAPLPALPQAWSDGSFSGLLARGAFVVSASWSQGHADRIEILSKAGGLLKLRYPGISNATITTPNGRPVSFKVIEPSQIDFDTKAGQRYVFTARSQR